MRYPICKTQWDIALTLPRAFVTVDIIGLKRRPTGNREARSKRNA